MSSFLAKRIISSCFLSSSPYHHHFHELALLTPLLRHSLSTQSQQVKELPFIAQHLVSSFGFSHDRALKVSSHGNVMAIKSEDRLNSVVNFLKDTGLSDTQIRGVISFCPNLLACNVEKKLKPKVRQLTDAGFSREILAHMIQYSPPALILKNTLLRLLFWRNFVGNNDRDLSKIIERNGLLITYDVDQYVLPRINLLKEYGFSNPDILHVLRNGCRGFMSKRVDFSRQKLELIEELGLRRGSGMFRLGFRALGNFSKNKIEENVEFFKRTYGWSQEEVCCAFVKFPSVLTFSKELVKSKMDFLISKAGLEARSVALRPLFLGCSLGRVLIPRYVVLSALEANGLKKKHRLFSVYFLSERCFLERYVVPYEKDVPGLGGAYAAALGGVVPA